MPVPASTVCSAERPRAPAARPWQRKAQAVVGAAAAERAAAPATGSHTPDSRHEVRQYGDLAREIRVQSMEIAISEKRAPNIAI